MKIHLIQGTHFRVPGTTISAAHSVTRAKEEALRIVNCLREEFNLPPFTNPEAYEEGLAEARQEMAAELHCDLEELGLFNADVWITEIELIEEEPA